MPPGPNPFSPSQIWTSISRPPSHLGALVHKNQAIREPQPATIVFASLPSVPSILPLILPAHTRSTHRSLLGLEAVQGKSARRLRQPRIIKRPRLFTTLPPSLQPLTKSRGPQANRPAIQTTALGNSFLSPTRTALAGWLMLVLRPCLYARPREPAQTAKPSTLGRQHLETRKWMGSQEATRPGP